VKGSPQKKPIHLKGEVETDEVYITAGHKGHPEVVARLGREGRRRKLRGKRGRGTLAEEKPPILGLLQRNGEVFIQMLPNVQQRTIQPIITKTVAAGSMIYSDEYDIYNRWEEWGYETPRGRREKLFVFPLRSWRLV
jgi:transposase-like protein